MKRPDYSKFPYPTYYHKEGDKTLRTLVLPPEVYENPFEMICPWVWDGGKSEKPNNTTLTRDYRTKEGITNRIEGDSWFGDINSYEDIQRKLRDGHKKGIEVIQSLVTECQQVANNNRGMLKNRRRVRVNGPEGDSFSYDRFQHRGLDQAWSTKKRAARGIAPIISICFLNSVHCGISEKQMAWRPAAALALSEMLSDMGYNVELSMLYVNKYTCDTDNVWCQRVTLKGADEPFRMQALSMATHVGIFRTIGFMMMGMHDTSQVIHDGLGWPWNENDPSFSSVHDVTKMGFEGTPVFLPCCFDEEEAMKSIKETLKKLQ